MIIGATLLLVSNIVNSVAVAALSIRRDRVSCKMNVSQLYRNLRKLRGKAEKGLVFSVEGKSLLMGPKELCELNADQAQ